MVRLDEGGRAAGDVRLYAPSPSLRDWVQHVSVQHGPDRRSPWRVVPDTCPHVIFTATASAARCRLVGARSTHADIDVDGRLVTVAVRLQPGTLPALIGARARELTDRAVDLADVLDAEGRRILEELPTLAARDVAARLMDVVGRCVRDREGPHLARVLAGATRVDGLQRLLRLSARALHARVVAEVGLAPKRALRIERLHAALHETGRGVPLATAALNAGYSDQAHLTREACALLGEAPTRWQRRGRADSFKTRQSRAG
jgi:AraC-like DNA-binding protein